MALTARQGAAITLKAVREEPYPFTHVFIFNYSSFIHIQLRFTIYPIIQLYTTYQTLSDKPLHYPTKPSAQEECHERKPRSRALNQQKNKKPSQ